VPAAAGQQAAELEGGALQALVHVRRGRDAAAVTQPPPRPAGARAASGVPVLPIVELAAAVSKSEWESNRNGSEVEIGEHVSKRVRRRLW
jgi:hypothetical protein